MDITKF